MCQQMSSDSFKNDIASKLCTFRSLIYIYIYIYCFQTMYLQIPHLYIYIYIYMIEIYVKLDESNT